MKYLEIYNDADGTSHLTLRSWPLQEGEFTPPSPAGYLISDELKTESTLMMHHPAGYKDEWHCAPAVVLGTVLRGEITVSTSDGDQSILSPGDQFLATDQRGAGHKMEELTGGPYDLALVILQENPDSGRRLTS